MCSSDLHEQALVAGVGEAVDRLGCQTRGSGHEESGELGDGDAEVREERGDDGLAAAFLHGNRIGRTPITTAESQLGIMVP